MADLDAATVVSQAGAAAAGFKVSPPSRISRGPAGVHLGNESGTSTEFHDFRDYQPGDDLRRVDWSVYARSDSLVIRQYRIEVSPVVEVLLDTSASMGVYDGKSAAATFVAAFLAAATRHAEGRPVLVLETERVTGGRIEPALTGLEYLTGSDPDVATGWPRGTGRPLRVLVSDLLFPISMVPYLVALSRDATALCIVQVLGQTEREPKLSGGLRLVDAENRGAHRDLHMNRSVLQRYSQRLTDHLASVEHAVRSVGATLVRLDVPDRFASPGELRSAVVSPLLERGVVETA
jgi:uncharacterized protein (DUF58 family)